MNLKDIVRKDCIKILEKNNKKSVLLELINILSESRAVDDVETLTERVLYREELMSTGIGLGIAIPHVRYEGVKRPTVAVGISKEGIADYKSIDDKIIKIVVMILVGKDQHKEHIKLLSEIVSKLKNNNGIDRLLQLETTEEIYSFFIK